MRMKANFEVENKTCAMTAARDSPFDMAISIHLRSKKSRSCLNIFFSRHFLTLSFGYLKILGFPIGGQVSKALCLLYTEGSLSFTGWNNSC